MKLLRSVCLLLVLFSAFGQLSFQNPPGIQTGLFTVKDTTTAASAAPVVISVTVSDTTLIATDYYVAAISELDSLSVTSYRLIPSIATIAGGFSASFGVLNPNWKIIKYRWLASNGLYVKPLSFSPPAASIAAGDFSVPVPATYNLKMTNGQFVKAAVVLSGFDYTNSAKTFDLALKLKTAVSHPIYGPNVFTRSATNDLVPVGGELPLTTSVGGANSIVLNVAFPATSTLSQIVFVLVLHAVNPQSLAIASTNEVLTGYAIFDASTEQAVSILDANKNILSIEEPQNFVGFSKLVLSAATLWDVALRDGSSSTAFISSNSGLQASTSNVFLYVSKYPCGLANLVTPAGIAPYTSNLWSCPVALNCPTGTTGVKWVQLTAPTADTTFTYSKLDLIAGHPYRFTFNLVINTASPTTDETLVVALQGSSITLTESGNGIPIATSATDQGTTYTVELVATSTVSNAGVFSFTLKSGTGANIQIYDFAVTEVTSVFDNQASPPACAACPSPVTATFSAVTTTLQPSSCNGCTGNRILTAAPKSCACPDGFSFFNVALQKCVACSVSYCKTCTTSATTCDTCMGNLVANAARTACSCAAGSAPNAAGNCDPCAAGCATCDVPDICTSCTNAAMVINTLTGKCECPGGQYSDAGVCKPCPTKCATCQKVAASGNIVCLSCPSVSHIDNGDCVCTDGSFLNTANPANIVCSLCQYTCLTCSGPNPTDCLTCPATRAKDVATSTCPCGTNLVDIGNKDCVQLQCSNLIPGCVTCTISTSTCLTCQTAAHFKPTAVAGRCQCDNGYFFNSVSNTCDLCGTGCATCTSLTTACTCYATATNSAANVGTCNCPTGFYPNAATASCVACSTTYCSTCPSNACNACVSPRTLSGGQCVCPVGYYDKVGVCTLCGTNCKTCDTNGVCTSCNVGSSLLSGSCGPCPDTFIAVGATATSGGFCISCPLNCKTCSTTYSCTVCQPTYYLYSGQCNQNCLTSQYKDNTAMTCVDCVSPCATCVTSPSTCTSCLPSTGTLFGNLCTQCNNGFTPVAGSCLRCDVNCATCLGSINTCTSCGPTLLLQPTARCAAICDPGTYLSVSRLECLVVCPDGTFPVGSSCTLCNPSCAACFGTASNCTRCPAGTYLSLGGTCGPCTAPYQPTTLPLLGGVCTLCAQNCAQCSGTTCTTCISNSFTLCGGKCLSCQGSTFLNPATCTCDICKDNCRVCTNATFCQTCVSTMITTLDGNCVACQPPCATCRPGEPSSCLTCNGGYALAGTTCVTSCPNPDMSIVGGICQCRVGVNFNGNCQAVCPAGYGPGAGNLCVLCSLNCEMCSGNADVCTSCRLGWNLVAGVCRSSNGCPLGTSSTNGICTRFCDNRRLYLDGFCYDACLPNYLPNAEGTACTPRTPNTSPCRTGEFYGMGTCFNQCPIGTYADGNVCFACTNNCMSCTNATYCLDCSPGYYLSSGRCLVSAVCPSPQLSLAQDCVTTCPEGTYPNGATCLPLCASGLFYYKGLCYLGCVDVMYSNGYGCIANCPAGQTPVDGICTGQGSACAVGLYYNTATRQCLPCDYPCASCVGRSNVCTSCLIGTLQAGRCQQGAGGQTGGNSLTVRVRSVEFNGRNLEIELGLSSIPSNIPNNIANQFFTGTVIPDCGRIEIYQWIDPISSSLHLIFEFHRQPPRNAIVLLNLNVAALAGLYINTGVTVFTGANAQVRLSEAAEVSHEFERPHGLSATFARKGQATKA